MLFEIMLEDVFADEKPFVFFTSLNRTKQKQWHNLGHTRFCLRAHGYVTDQIIFPFSPSSPVTIHAYLLLIPLCNFLSIFFSLLECLFPCSSIFFPALISLLINASPFPSECIPLIP